MLPGGGVDGSEGVHVSICADGKRRDYSVRSVSPCGCVKCRRSDTSRVTAFRNLYRVLKESDCLIDKVMSSGDSFKLTNKQAIHRVCDVETRHIEPYQPYQARLSGLLAGPVTE